MSLKKWVVLLLPSVFAIGLAVAVAGDSAHGGAGHREHAQAHGKGARPHGGEFVKLVREATRRFHDLEQAKAEGYQLLFGCVSGPDDGAMGMHYVNLGLVADG